jgi:RNA polymerase sigma factor (TIGR02999 family)
MSDIDDLWADFREKRPGASKRLVEHFYGELKRRAERLMASERADHSLQATALVNELYMKIFRSDAPKDWNDAQHFIRWATRSMANILKDHAKTKNRQRRGGGLNRHSLSEDPEAKVPGPDEPVDVWDALDELAQHYPDDAEVAVLRHGLGYSISEIAALLDCSQSEIDATWRRVKAYLRVRLKAYKQ